LSLPQEWTSDDERLRKAEVPDDITFKIKHEIALDRLRWPCATGLPRGVVLMEAGYGNNSELRAQITALDLTYVAGIPSDTTVWSHRTGPLPPNVRLCSVRADGYLVKPPETTSS
jgi:SRSO17 transposase